MPIHCRCPKAHARSQYTISGQFLSRRKANVVEKRIKWKRRKKASFVKPCYCSKTYSCYISKTHFLRPHRYILTMADCPRFRIYHTLLHISGIGPNLSVLFLWNWFRMHESIHNAQENRDRGWIKRKYHGKLDATALLGNKHCFHPGDWTGRNLGFPIILLIKPIYIDKRTQSLQRLHSEMPSLLSFKLHIAAEGKQEQTFKQILCECVTMIFWTFSVFDANTMDMILRHKSKFVSANRFLQDS